MTTEPPTSPEQENDDDTIRKMEGLIKTMEELEFAATDAMGDLVKLLDKLNDPSMESMNLALDHLLVQDSAAQDLQERTSESVEAGRSMVNASLELMEVLEETEGLEEKVKTLRRAVDGVVESLKLLPRQGHDSAMD
ncbi:hypothetical protein BSKO_06284 [Bryopsis sp. KO-2023]|nr:hypothetical protein BSKO_06284 [Bryopsis sp. KO-2023]